MTDHRPTNTPHTNPENWLTALEAAKLLKCKAGTLANKRVKGEGPAFIKYDGRVFYHKDVIAQHLAKRARMYRSTLEWKKERLSK